MVGDLVPEDDEVWLFVLLLIEIIDCILSFDVNVFLITHSDYS